MPNDNRAVPLTNADVVEMRKLRAETGAPLSYLAWLFETSLSNVHLIVSGKTHKDAGGPITPLRGFTSEEEVLAIRHRRAEGIPYRQLQEEFGKSGPCLRTICSGQSFPHVGGPRSGSKKQVVK